MSVATKMPGRRFIPIARPDMATFTDVQKEVVKALMLQGAAILTIQKYEECYGQFFAYLKREGLDNDMKHFTDEHIRGFVQYVKALGVTSNTVRGKLSALRTFSRYAMTLRDKRGKYYVDEDPTRRIVWPKVQHKESKYLYTAELAKFWAAPAPPHVDIAREMFIDTGARISSLINANVGDLRTIEGDPFVMLTVKGGSQKAVALSKAAAAKLHAYLLSRELTERDDDRPLLARADGSRWVRTTLAEILTRLAKSAGLTRFRVGPHKLRHTKSVLARDAHLDAETRGRLLTHSADTNRRTYDHEIPGELAKAQETYRQHLEGKVKQGGDVLTPRSATMDDDLTELGEYA